MVMVMVILFYLILHQMNVFFFSSSFANHSTSIKLGAYAPVRDALGAGKDSPFYLKFLAGAITGGV